jgi:hypothetical protein
VPCTVRARLAGDVTHLDCEACHAHARLEGEALPFAQYIDGINAFLSAHRPLPT